jgi:hypothetical protein
VPRVHGHGAAEAHIESCKEEGVVEGQRAPEQDVLVCGDSFSHGRDLRYGMRSDEKRRPETIRDEMSQSSQFKGSGPVQSR